MTSQVNKQWYIMAVVILTAYLVYLLAPILTPFAVGALMAYLFDPLADKLEKLKLSRTLSVTIVFFCHEFNRIWHCVNIDTGIREANFKFYKKSTGLFSVVAK